MTGFGYVMYHVWRLKKKVVFCSRARGDNPEVSQGFRTPTLGFSTEAKRCKPRNGLGKWCLRCFYDRRWSSQTERIQQLNSSWHSPYMLVYKDPLLTHRLVSMPSILTLRYVVTVICPSWLVSSPKGSGRGTPSKSPVFMAYKWGWSDHHFLSGMILLSKPTKTETCRRKHHGFAWWCGIGDGWKLVVNWWISCTVHDVCYQHAIFIVMLTLTLIQRYSKHVLVLM